jgi:site-specific recombinase XerD
MSQDGYGIHIPCNRDAVLALRNAFGDIPIETGKLKQQLLLRQYHLPARSSADLVDRLHPVNLDALNRFLKTLELKAYSPSTIKLYRIEFIHLLRLLQDRRVDLLETDQLKSYFLWLLKEQGYGESQLNTAINAVKFYFEKVLLQPRRVFDLPRPKKPLLLPQVLGKRSISGIINAMENLKHRCMLMLAYSAGLRVSEIVALKIRDVDSDRMCLNICRAKGKKDRVVPLSPVLLEELRQYFKKFRPREYLFEGADGGMYSIRSVQQVFKNAKDKAGIKQPGGIHSLRHSYATHLLESGTDIRFIQELLGHNNILTTHRYTHVSLRKITQIRSPLDDLDL